MRALLLLLLAVPLAAQAPLKIRRGSATAEVPLERYVAGVLAGESSVFQSAEALKAMAVAARTYAVKLRGRHAAEGFDFCTTTHCQRFDPASVTRRLEDIAADTAGELLWFEGKPAFACYSRDCGDRTEYGAAVWPELRAAPYLKSHDDPYCARGGGAAWQWRADAGQVASALRRSGLRVPDRVEAVAIAERTASGRARTLVLSGGGESVRISAGSFRFAVGRALGWNSLPSDYYEVAGLFFAGRGSGHGVGLCQRGADRMGVEGHTYREILAYYYPGTEIGLTGRGLSWQRLGGDSAVLFTTQPANDGPVLEIAERNLRALRDRTNLEPPRGIEIRVYPDVDTFRNATGEPGWVAAHTRGRRIDLQPAAVLRSRGVLEQTLRHELAHALVESYSAVELPVWFREGLAGVLAGDTRGAQALRASSESEMRVRRAYADAVRTVGASVERYGLTAVLGWLKTGLPRDVSDANSNHAEMNRR